ncbi:MAG: homocysteine S-methyltransferase family protein, partial [Firmicutes bacterium]|nr:homocysteine S-methyltransferase family protein [Bacillota bacterium]
MGTFLQRAGLPSGACPEEWNLTHPETVTGIHESYLAAGARIIETNTFGGTRRKLAEYGLAGRLREINAAGAAAAARARERHPAGGTVLIAGSVGPTGSLLEPLGDLSFAEAVDLFAEQVEALAAGGVDLILVETMADLQEARSAVIGARRAAPRLPLLVSLTFGGGGRTLTGTDPAGAAVTLEAMGVDGLGVNCSGGPEELLGAVRSMRAVTGIPMIAYPNAGLPRLESGSGSTIFPLGPDGFAGAMLPFVEAGANILGGCCGTGPDHIRALAQAVEGRSPSFVPKARGEDPRAKLASRSRWIILDDLPGIAVVGERINPTSRRLLSAEIREGQSSLLRAEARRQAEAGADLLDVNVGVPGIDETLAMTRAVQAIQDTVDLPLVLDSSAPEPLAAGLAAYTGKALLNSVNGEQEKLASVLPLAAAWGGAVVALCLDERGIPPTAAGRLEIAERIARASDAAGIPRADLFIDCLTLTAGAEQAGPAETLRAIAMVKDRLGARTILGVSNVSFGLPARSLLNATFLAMAVGAGLDSAIINPFDEGVMGVVRAAAVLLGRDRDSARYVACYGGRGKDAPAQAIVPAIVPAPDGDPLVRLREGILRGDRDVMVPAAREALALQPPLALIQQVLTPALQQVGEYFSEGRYFLPQLMTSAEAMEAACRFLEGHLPDKGDQKGTVVMATVQGDIHDIGKNIVALMLRNYGYRVVDLGKNIPADEILRAAREHRADLVGLSALMTTTMVQMGRVIDLLRSQGLPVPVVIGGAATSREFAGSIGADGHASDAAEAVKLVRGILG